MSAVRKTVTMSRRKAIDIFNACSWVERTKEPLDQHFSYAVSYNQESFGRIVKADEKALKANKPFLAYDEARIELVKKYAKKDKNGEPVSENNEYIIEDAAQFQKDLISLREEHSAYQEREDYLDEDIEVELHIIKMRYVPKFITVGYMKQFMCFIEYEEPEIVCPCCKEELKFVDGDLVAAKGEVTESDSGNVTPIDKNKPE